MNMRPELANITDCLYRVAVKAVIIKDNKALVVIDNRDTGWSFPGGGVDLGESPQQALMRELHEEIGVNPADVDVGEVPLSISIGHVRGGIPRCNIHYAVTLRTDSIKKHGEVEVLTWKTIEELEIEELDASAGDKRDFITAIKLASQEKLS